MTKYERIKAMSIDEMADYLNEIFDCSNCPNDMFYVKVKALYVQSILSNGLKARFRNEKRGSN